MIYMCWHHKILGDFRSPLKVEFKFREPLNTGFDILIIGEPAVSTVEKDRIISEYKGVQQLQKFRGGIKDVLFYATEESAGINHPTYSYTLTPFGMCSVQKNIRTNLKNLGVSNTATVQKDYNEYVRGNPDNAEAELRSRNHIP